MNADEARARAAEDVLRLITEGVDVRDPAAELGCAPNWPAVRKAEFDWLRHGKRAGCPSHPARLIAVRSTLECPHLERFQQHRQ